jgi:hypothetical protein
MKRLITLILGLLPILGFSQEAVVKTEIVTIALAEPVNGLFFHNGESVSAFQANPTGLGEPLKYHGPRHFQLRTTEAEFSMTPPLPAAHASVDLPIDASRVLIACIKSGNNPVKMIAYDIGNARIGAGEYRFFNFSRSPVAVVLGPRKFVVKSGQDTLVSHAAWKSEIGEIDLALAIMKDGRAKPVYSSQWGNRPGRRNYVFLFDGPQEYKPIRICRFFDVPPAGSDIAGQ